MTTLTIKRVGENLYVAYLSGCVVGGSYTMQLRLAPPVASQWEYAGVFVAVDGTITTWEWAIPNLQYPSEFRFVYDVDGSASNVVTIDPKNPPPINGEVPPPPPTIPQFQWWWITIPLVAVGVGLVYLAVKKK